MDSASFSSTMLYPTLPALPRPSAPPLYPELDNSYDSLIPPEPSAPPAEDSDAYAAAVDSDTKLAETMPASQLPPLPEFFIHEVRQSDTLQGLCLQYKISIRELKRYNQFPRENFRIMKKLRIPLVKGARLQEPATQDELIYNFSRMNGLSMAEAKYYLEEAGFDAACAKEALRGDLAWEKAHPVVPGEEAGLRKRAPRAEAAK